MRPGSTHGSWTKTRHLKVAQSGRDFTTDPPEADDPHREVARASHLIEGRGQPPLALTDAEAVGHDLAR